MRNVLTCLLLLAFGPVAAQDAAQTATPAAVPVAEATDGIFLDPVPDSIDDLRWIKRIVAVFADSPNDPLFRRQMEALQADPEPLAFRDVVVLTDTDPAADINVTRGLGRFARPGSKRAATTRFTRADRSSRSTTATSIAPAVARQPSSPTYSDNHAAPNRAVA